MDNSRRKTDKNSIINTLDKLVAQCIPATVILAALDMTSHFCRVSQEVSAQHRRENEKAWQEKGHLALDSHGVFLEYQNRLDFLQYGRQNDWLSRHLLNGRMLTGKENTCEVSAVYNSLCYLGKMSAENEQKSHDLDMKNLVSEGIIKNTITFPALLEYFEGNGLAFGGYFGTSPKAIGTYLRCQGFQVKTLTGRQITKPAVEMLEKDMPHEMPRAYILTGLNDKNRLSGMIHTMCITKETNGYVMHNDYEGTKVYGSLTEAVFGYRSGMGKPMMVMRIEDKY